MESIASFEVAARQVGAVVSRVSADTLESEVCALLKRRGVPHVAMNTSRVQLADFERQSARSAACGITDAEWGIASTGTLILPMLPGKERAASLVPPIHVAILPAERIVAGLPEALALVADRYKRTPDRLSSVVFVTGPSRTADIELHLVMGVHGPKELFVFLLV